VTTRDAARATIAAARRQGLQVGLVPTMGALHEGHLSLVDASRLECDCTAVTIFVNPTQFAPGEDFAKYPRDLDADLRLLGERGVDLVFAPAVEEMYPAGHQTTVDVGAVAVPLEGKFRPQHFRGVATIVLKLFHALPADVAFFGQKDYQQSLVIRQLVRDLDVPIEIRVCPIVREPDGLAMSSRNAYLSADERRRALSLSQALRVAADRIDGGERSTERLRQRMREHLQQAGPVDVQYIAFLADGTVREVEEVNGPVVIAIAARVGETRLIDNVRIF